MKLTKISIIFIILMAIFFLIVNNRLLFLLSPSTPFIFNLKSKPIQTVEYLEETDSTTLPLNNTTIGIYSTKDDVSQLKEIFQTAGTPFYFSDSLTKLKGAKIIFLDLSIDNPTALSSKETTFLDQFIKNGGIVIGNEILSTRFGLLKKLFGYKSYIPSKEHTKFTLKDNKFYKYLDTDEEKNYIISNINIAPYTNSIIVGSAKVIATYEDNTPAITINSYGKGFAINLGISLYDLRYRNLLDKDFNANISNRNGFEPLSDFIIMLIKSVYQVSIEKSIFLHTSANNTQSALIMTHNIKTESHLKNIDKLISMEKKLKIPSTCFINVKYLSDNKIDAFFKLENFPYINNLVQNGIEIGVLGQPVHKSFFLLPFGSCKEKYPLYQQFGLSDVSNSKTTLCGELKVSKELLAGINIKDIVSFRSSGLVYNKQLPLALQNLGYRYSSLFSSEDILSYFPFRYPNDYSNTEDISKIWEIPITLDNQSLIPMYLYSSAYIELFKKVYNNGGVFNMNISPKKTSILTTYFIEKFYNSIPKDVWKCSLKEFGSFWDKRDRVIFRYKIIGSKLTLNIYSPSDIKGLTFKIDNIHIKEQYGIKVEKDKFSLDIKRGDNRWNLSLEP